MRRTVITGTGSYIPSRKVSNEEFMKNRFFMDYDQPIDTADNEKTVGKFQEITEIATRMGYKQHYNHPSEIMDEIASLVPIYGGISYDRLEELGSIQWPCPTKDHPGTTTLPAR